MIALIRSGFLLLLLLSGCGWDGTPTRKNDFVPLTSIEISAVSSTIAAQTSMRFTATGNRSGLFTENVTDQAVWSSDTPTVAAFATATGRSRVTGLIPGTAIVTATVGGVSSTFVLTVSSSTVTALTITPDNPNIAKGRSTQFIATGTFSDLPPRDITFDVSWTSSAPAVASVSDAVGSKGLSQAIAVGTSTITATFAGVSDSTQLTVIEPVLQSITVSPPNPSVLSVSTGSFKAIGHYSDGTTPDITGLVTWNSSQSRIATITAGGALTTLAQGTSSINATLDGVSGTTDLKVTGGNLTGITLSTPTITPVNGTITLVKDTVGRLIATGTFSNGAVRDITGVVSWSVENPALATVSTPGGNLALLTATAATSATAVKSTFGAQTATTILAVTIPTLNANGLLITPANRALTVKTSGRFAVTATFSDGTTQNVTESAVWTSSNPSVAEVGDSGSNKGRVSGIAAGTATISAVYGGQTVTAPVTVTARTLLTLTVTPATTFPPGYLVKYTAIANYSDLSIDVTEDTTWTWAEDKPSVAVFADTLNQPGQVVTVDSGLATLTASFDGKTLTSTITVTAP